MEIYQGLIFIWIVFHHARIIPAASLRSEYLDTSFRDEIKSHPDQKLHNSRVEQSNYYRESDEKAKFRPMLPYERRNRPIFTSKTYFGKNQMKELPRKYWAKEDETISPLRVKAAPHMYPIKYAPQRSPRVQFHHQDSKIPKVQLDEHKVEVPDQNIRYVYDQYGPNPGYGSKEYGPNPGYGSKEEYGPNPGYGSMEGYGQNPGYDTKYEYGVRRGYDSINKYGRNPVYMSKEEYGHQNPEYATKEEYGHQNPVYATKEYGNQNPGYESKDKYDSNRGYADNDEYEKDLGFDAKEGYFINQGRDANSGYGQESGYFSNVGYGPNPGYVMNTGSESESGYHANARYGSDPERGTNIEHSQNRHHESSKLGLNFETNIHTSYNLNPPGYHPKPVYDSNFGYGGNAEGFDLEEDFKKKLMGSRIEESDFFSLGANSETSTALNLDFNIDENLKKDELLRNSDEENFRKMSVDITSDESDDTKELEEFEGSGEIENELDTLSILDQEANKSARILDIFPRFNDSAQCTTPKNESGHCRGLTECPLIETMENFSSFLQYMCFQRGRLVGICCPDNPVIEVKESVDEKSSEKVKLDIQQPTDGCGFSSNTRIVGGTMSLPHEFSWMVALLRRNRFYCGGVIINNWYILTAAHCVLGIKISDLKVRLGEFDFHQRNEIQHDIPVTEIKRHALFVTSTFQHDIALLKLKRKIEYTKFIGSICLPNKDEDFSKKNATVAGWGTVSFGGAASPILRKVTVPVWDNKECDRTYVFERINESFLCAGSSVSGEDACQGDSGGPLMSMNDEGRWEVIGIVSWGRRCGDPSYPGVYTRVTSYLDWIAENAQ